MRTPIAGAALALLLACPPVAAVEGELEVGGYYVGLSEDLPDWSGQRSLLRLRPYSLTTAQLELLESWVGDDWGQLLGAAVWQGFGPRFWVFGDVVGSMSSDFLPTWRSDAELHFATPGLERLQPFFGGGYADYEDYNIGIWTLGASYFLPYEVPALLTYRFMGFENDVEASSGAGGNGRLHHVQLLLGREDGFFGQQDLSFAYGSDLIRDFIVSGGSQKFRLHGLRVGWRRNWFEPFGTYLSFEWAHKEAIHHPHSNFDSLGVELRLIWYFGRAAQAAPEPSKAVW